MVKNIIKKAFCILGITLIKNNTYSMLLRNNDLLEKEISKTGKENTVLKQNKDAAIQTIDKLTEKTDYLQQELAVAGKENTVLKQDKDAVDKEIVAIDTKLQLSELGKVKFKNELELYKDKLDIEIERKKLSEEKKNHEIYFVREKNKEYLQKIKNFSELKKFVPTPGFTGIQQNSWKPLLKQILDRGLRSKFDRLTFGMDKLSIETINSFIERMESLPINKFASCFRYKKDSFVYETMTQWEREIIIENPILDISSYAKPFKERYNLIKAKDSDIRPETFMFDSGLTLVPDAHERINNRIVIDCGAFLGETSIRIMDQYSPKEIHAFEPSKVNYRDALLHISNNKMEDKITLKNYAVNNKNGTIQFDDRSNSSSTAGFEISGLQGNLIDVKCISLDSYVSSNKISDIACIKMDVEGVEYNAIQGMKNTIIKERPILLVSIYHTVKDFFEIKPFLENLKLDYKFIIRHINPYHNYTMFGEYMLICY